MTTGNAEIDLIFVLSLLLAFGFALARLAKLARLPEVTGYLVAGIILGPSGFELITREMLDDLTVFMNMAIVLIAFSIGEGCDLRQLKPLAKVLWRISPVEVGLTFILSTAALAIGAVYLGLLDPAHALPHALAVGLICAAVATETSAPVTMAVVRECGAAGALTRILTSLMVLNSVATIIFFGAAMAVAQVLVGGWDDEFLGSIAFPFYHVVGALIVGFVAGIVCDIIVHRLTRRSDVLIVALATIFFCGGLAFQLGLSAILAGVGAGIAVVNRDRRDVRAFSATKDFDPPLYALFFTLAGVGVFLDELVSAGLLVIIFVIARMAGKVGGAMIGARWAGLRAGWGKMLGSGLLAQAGLSISLAVLVAQDPDLQPIQALVVNLIIASNIINVTIGPPLTRLALIRSGEARAIEREEEAEGAALPEPQEELIIDTVPWVWPKLQSAEETSGSVVIGLGHPQTAPALTRIGVMLAYGYRAEPTAVYVSRTSSPENFWAYAHDQDALGLFRVADQEAEKMGSSIVTEVAFEEDVTSGLLKVAREEDARLILIGQTKRQQEEQFSRVVSRLSTEAACPVVVAQLTGPLHTERILVPFADEDEYRGVLPILRALTATGSDHSITFLRMMPLDSAPSEVDEAEEEIAKWPGYRELSAETSRKAVTVESRVQEIAREAEEQDLIVMASSAPSGLRRMLFGSLPDDVAEATHTSMLVVAGIMGADRTELDNQDPT